MTDAEIDALAQELFNTVAKEIINIAPQVTRIGHKADGSPFLEFWGLSKEGKGAFYYRYDALTAIKKLIRESERIFDDFEITVINTVTKQTSVRTLKASPGDDRDRIIKFMAHAAALQMVGAVFPRLTEMMDDGFEESKLLAEAIIMTTVANSPDSDDEVLSHARTDLSSDIDAAAKKVYDRARKRLRDYVRMAPHVVVAHPPGRKPKSIYEIKREAAEYTAAVKTAIRDLWLVANKKPTKVSVADRLGEGGIDPKRGSDTRLNAFNLKLTRYEINYDELISQVEAELHNNAT